MSSDTRTMTLTDFLLDRLADLELAAQIALATAPPEPVEGITPAGAVWFTPEQVLADVAAKRQIVEAREELDREVRRIAVPGAEQPDVDGLRMSRFGLDLAIKILAAAHDDHPDYRPEWKP